MDLKTRNVLYEYSSYTRTASIISTVVWVTCEKFSGFSPPLPQPLTPHLIVTIKTLDHQPSPPQHTRPRTIKDVYRSCFLVLADTRGWVSHLTCHLKLCAQHQIGGWALPSRRTGGSTLCGSSQDWSWVSAMGMLRCFRVRRGCTCVCVCLRRVEGGGGWDWWLLPQGLRLLQGCFCGGTEVDCVSWYVMKRLNLNFSSVPTVQQDLWRFGLVKLMYYIWQLGNVFV